MPKPKDEPKAGVPAFMATFADLMTLLLVFFILLNVYANERQTGLIAAMRGSMRSAFHDTFGLDGLLEGSRFISEQKASRNTYVHRDKEPGPESDVMRMGNEVELRKSSAEDLEVTEQVEMTAPFAFDRGSDKIPAAGRRFLEELARDLQGGDFIVELEARSSFAESMTPMELATARVGNAVRYLERVGLRARIEPSARVLASMRGGGRSSQATYTLVSLRIVRHR